MNSLTKGCLCRHGFVCILHKNKRRKKPRYRTKIRVTTDFIVMDLTTGKISIRKMRGIQDRTNYMGFELSTATATCNKCRNFVDCTSYHITNYLTNDKSTPFVLNTNLCNPCQDELKTEETVFKYVKDRMRKTYNGTNRKILKAIQKEPK